MPDRTLLPNEPGVLHWDVEQDLTERHLWPVRRELEVFFLALRESLDARLRAAQPFKLGKPYPLGQCLEITQAVQTCLQHPAAPLHGAAADGFAALSAFVLAGGTARQVWGDLRGEYFQNAFCWARCMSTCPTIRWWPASPRWRSCPGPRRVFQRCAITGITRCW